MDHCQTKIRLLRINTHSLLSTNRKVKTQSSGTTDKEIINSFLDQTKLICQFMVHCVREQSGFFDLAQTERNMQIKFDLKLSGYSLGVDI